MEEQLEVNHLCFFLSFFFPYDTHLSPLVALLDCMCFSAFCYLINPSIIPQQQVADNDTFHQLSLPQAPAITRCPNSQSVRLPLNNDRSQFCTIMYESVVRSYAASRKTVIAVVFFPPTFRWPILPLFQQNTHFDDKLASGVCSTDLPALVSYGCLYSGGCWTGWMDAKTQDRSIFHSDTQIGRWRHVNAIVIFLLMTFWMCE